MAHKVEIKHRYTGAVLFSFDATDEQQSNGLVMRHALEAAVEARADLADADLAGANLADAKGSDLVIAMSRILPDGQLIGWKKCDGNVIVKLQIPAEAKRSHAFGRKCRAEFADVLEVIGGDVGITDNHGPRTEYRVGQRVKPDSFDDNWMDECSNGIHFFITRLEAENYA
jgi:hypothetical protein